MTRVCSDCPNEIGPKNRSGRCRSCAAARHNADPIVAQKRRDGIRRRFAEPEYRARHAARCAENNRNISDEVRERRRQHGRTMVDTLAAASRAMTKAARADNGRKRSDTVLAWCPPEWRDRYRDLKKRGRRAAVAKKIVLDLIAGRPMPVAYAKQKAQLAWCPPARRAEYEAARVAVGAAEARRIIEADLSPFERQMARLAAGAQLIAVPDFRTPDPAFTLGGIASASF